MQCMNFRIFGVTYISMNPEGILKLVFLFKHGMQWLYTLAYMKNIQILVSNFWDLVSFRLLVIKYAFRQTLLHSKKV